MKRTVLIIIFAVFLANPDIYASQGFQAASPPGGDILRSDESIVSIQYKEIALDEITQFYEKELKGKDNIKWKMLKDENKLVINDWGNREWHKINVIDKGAEGGVFVTITRDSWSWIAGTLIIRFIGVLVVLIVLWIGMVVSGKILSSLFSKEVKGDKVKS